jgi:hypothetical protein
MNVIDFLARYPELVLIAILLVIIFDTRKKNA